MTDLTIRTEGRAGRITLTRPQALNALTHAMVREIDAALVAWADDDRVAHVVIDGEGPRAFCSGGDIAEVYASGRRGDFATGAAFWADEYRMNARIAGYAKPYVALMHGFVMGGGVGVAAHGSHRIVGDTTQVAMPECAIGLIPDIGGTALLAAAPGRLGEYLGLTGHRMGAGDAIRAGFADSYVPEDRWPDLTAALLDTDDPDEAIAAFAEPAPPAALAAGAGAIDDAFEAADLAALAARLEASDWGHGILRKLRGFCPLSMACTLELVRAARRDPGVEKALRPRVPLHRPRLLGRRVPRGRPRRRHRQGPQSALARRHGQPPPRGGRRHARAPRPRPRPALTDGRIPWTSASSASATWARRWRETSSPPAMPSPASTSAACCPRASPPPPPPPRPPPAATVVVTMLPNGAILRAVYAEIVAAAAPGTVLVDCSTVDVESARAVAAQATAAGLGAVDAPVSGGTGGAAAGTLTFMAGGAPDAFETVRPLFEIMGSRAVLCGPSGAGQAAKICNNMILGISMLGVAEAFALAAKLGLDAQALYDVVSTSSGACWSVTTYCPVPGVGPKSPADNDYRPGFAADLMLKDLRLAQDAAAAADAATPLGAHAAALYDAFVAGGGHGRDFSAVLPWLAARHHGEG